MGSKPILRAFADLLNDIRVIFGLYGVNGKENGNDCNGLYRGCIGYTLGLFGDNGKENWKRLRDNGKENGNK